MNQTVNQRILYQSIFWLVIFFGLPFIVSGGKIVTFDFVHRFQILVSLIIIIVINLKILFPKFYHFNRFKIYILTVAGCIALIRITSMIIFEADLEEAYLRFPTRIKEGSLAEFGRIPARFIQFFTGAIPLLMITLVSTLYETSILANQRAKETALLKAEKLETELKFLKSQINPHFLFNSLNNIYTLTLLDPNAAGKNLLKLSKMLRYLLYECDAERVSLEKELTYLQNYIDLFSLKDDEPLNIKFETQNVNTDVQIAPLLFIPFVENAFKHSQIEDLENGWIYISIIGDNKQLYFEIKNSVPKQPFSKDDVGGIGLQNVKRQLELLYPNNHELNIVNTDEEYEVFLNLHL